ncbi:MAG TPA: RDD family protein [Terriglobales bacterium]|nr:RDD family protein [Terriglobales bacterium]
MPNRATANGWTDFPADQESSAPSDCVIDAALAPSASKPTTTFASSPSSSPNEPSAELTSDSWRVEVAARLERYRTRRKPRSPRYPSLFLPFDAAEHWSRSTPAPRETVATGGVASAASEREPTTTPHRDFSKLSPEPSRAPSHELSPQTGNVIEFPRSAAIPVYHASDLADPVFDHSRPRIVEAPEILPPPPALGGMLIEPTAQELANKQAQSSTTFPSTSASIAQRAFAALIDGIILAASIGAFAAIFLRLNPSLKPDLHPSLASLPLLIGAVTAVAAVFWAVYQFFFIVYTGSSPGLRAARLSMTAFDGSRLSRSARRWRVFASFLSAISAGLGYLWCLLDQQGLCWHDRITRTHIRPAAPDNAPDK